jgi:hypothetical protein
MIDRGVAPIRAEVILLGETRPERRRRRR